MLETYRLYQSAYIAMYGQVSNCSVLLMLFSRTQALSIFEFRFLFLFYVVFHFFKFIIWVADSAIKKFRSLTNE